MNEQEKTAEITFGFLVAIVRRFFLILLIVSVAGAGLAFAATKLLIDPVYSSTAEFAVENTSGEAGVMNSGYQMGAVQYATNYANEVEGNVFLSEILNAYNTKYGKNLTLKQLTRKISATSDGELPVFTIKVVSTDPNEAYDILATVQDMTRDLLLNDSTRKYVNIKPIEYGSLATAPDSPNVFLNTVLGTIIAFAIAYVAIFLKVFLDKTVYDEEMVKNISSLPIVGQIPRWSDKKSEGGRAKNKAQHFDTKGNKEEIQRDYAGKLLGPKTPFSVSESFKTLRTNLTYVARQDKSSPVFAVTSGFAGAGKSVVIANIAISFSQLGKKVLLIDGDMRCPVQHKVFSVAADRNGLSETLAGIEENPFENAVIHDVYGSLDLMTCGRIPPNPSELLSSDRMQQFLEEAKARYDYVLIDLPPVLETADAGAVTSIISSYIIVVRAGYSKIDAVQTVVESMQAMRANMAGFVLNDVNGKGAFGYYSHYGHRGKYSKYVYRDQAEQK